MKMTKKVVMLLLTLIWIGTLYAQDISGQWNGLLEIPGSPLRLSLNISKTGSGYTATLDSPDQGAMGIPVNTATFTAPKLDIGITALNLTYSAELVEDKFKGTFTQGGFTLPLELSREMVEKRQVKRPQEPKEPFPYYTEEVDFPNNEAHITLSGTLSLPSKNGEYPVVILITGSGPQNRNEELAGHKPFLVISDYLTRKGIGVLRYDDRGVGKSTGDFKSATSLDFVSDVESAVNYLKTRKEVDLTNIGLIGHSEGGIIAPMVAAKSKDIGFIVLMAGTGIPGDELLSIQGQLIEKASGRSENEVKKSAMLRDGMIALTKASQNIPELRSDLMDYLQNEAKNAEFLAMLPERMDAKQFIKAQVDFMATPWMVYFLRHDPAKVLKKVSCPVLALNGDKDLQVPAEINLSAIEGALKKGGNENVTLKKLSGLNHLFQESRTGSPMEYGTIEQTFSPTALTEISGWIMNHVDLRRK